MVIITTYTGQNEGPGAKRTQSYFKSANAPVQAMKWCCNMKTTVAFNQITMFELMEIITACEDEKV